MVTRLGRVTAIGYTTSRLPSNTRKAVFIMEFYQTDTEARVERVLPANMRDVRDELIWYVGRRREEPPYESGRWRLHGAALGERSFGIEFLGSIPSAKGVRLLAPWLSVHVFPRGARREATLVARSSLADLDNDTSRAACPMVVAEFGHLWAHLNRVWPEMAKEAKRRRALKKVRDRQETVLELYPAGKTISDIAIALSAGESTIWKDLATMRADGRL